MRLKLLPVVVILFFTGSIESRPQKAVSDIDETEWRPIAPRRVDSPESVPIDSRYIRNRGNVRFPYYYNNNGSGSSRNSRSFNTYVNPSFVFPQNPLAFNVFQSRKSSNEPFFEQARNFASNGKAKNVRYSFPVTNRFDPDISISRYPKDSLERSRNVIPISAMNHESPSLANARESSDLEYVMYQPRSYVKLLPEYQRIKSTTLKVVGGSKDDLKVTSLKHKPEESKKKQVVSSKKSNSTATLLVTKNSFKDKAKPSNIIRIQPVANTTVTDLKNWPNDKVQSTQDLSYYEKYTSLSDEDDGNVESPVILIKPKPEPAAHFKPNRKKPPKTSGQGVSYREPSMKLPLNTAQWMKVPTVTVTQNPLHDKPVYEYLDPSKPLDLGPVISTLNPSEMFDDKNMTRLVEIEHKPTSEVTQNTVVHILNAGSLKPNVTVTESMVPETPSISTKSTSPAYNKPQNVHIMFTSDKDGDETLKNSGNNASGLVSDENCPTITINSITKINNTIQSKEGCTDLNIIINSHILNTNIIKPISDAPNPDLKITDQNNQGADQTSTGVYVSSEGQSIAEVQLTENDNAEISSFEVFQGTHINFGSGATNPENDDGAQPVPANTDSVTASEFAGGEIGEEVSENVPEGITEVPTDPPQDPDKGTSDSTDTNGLSQSAQTEDSVGQSNDVVSGVDIPSPSIPNRPNLPNQISNVRPDGQGGNTGLIPAADDDDGEIDYSPLGFIDYLESMFSHYTYLNPLNYGIFSVAVAPFAAFAAGVIGVSTFLFPWAFPGAFDLARSHKSSSSEFMSNLEEVVKQSIESYSNWNEWKSKRKKHKR